MTVRLNESRSRCAVRLGRLPCAILAAARGAARCGGRGRRFAGAGRRHGRHGRGQQVSSGTRFGAGSRRRAARGQPAHRQLVEPAGGPDAVRAQWRPHRRPRRTRAGRPIRLSGGGAQPRRGAELVRGIIDAEGVLADASRASGFGWHPDNYWLAFFGEPSAGADWSWQFGGHHLDAINVAVTAAGAMSMSPSFIGIEPAVFVRDGAAVARCATTAAGPAWPCWAPCPASSETPRRWPAGRC